MMAIVSVTSYQYIRSTDSVLQRTVIITGNLDYYTSSDSTLLQCLNVTVWAKTIQTVLWEKAYFKNFQLQKPTLSFILGLFVKQ